MRKAIVLGLFLLVMVGCAEAAAKPAPTAVPTVTFAPGKTEADIINEAALCRLLLKGYSADEIRGSSLVRQEAKTVLQEHLDGKFGMSRLHELTQELCAGG